MRYRGLRLSYRGMTVADAVQILDVCDAASNLVYHLGGETTPLGIRNLGYDRLGRPWAELPADKVNIGFSVGNSKWVEGTLSDMVTHRLNAKLVKPRKHK